MRILPSSGKQVKVENIKICDFPKGLQEKAAKQLLYNKLVDPSQVNSEKEDIYAQIQAMDIEPYIVPVFKEHDKNAEYLLSLEISNMLQSSSYVIYDQELVSQLIYDK